MQFFKPNTDLMLEFTIIILVVSALIMLACHNYDVRRNCREMKKRYGSQVMENRGTENIESKVSAPEKNSFRPEQKINEITK